MKSRTITRNAMLGAFASSLMIASTAASAASYNCNRYVDGKPTGGHVNVSASSESEAVQLALEKYRNKLKMRTDSVKCKPALF